MTFRIQLFHININNQHAFHLCKTSNALVKFHKIVYSYKLQFQNLTSDALHIY